MIVGVPKELKTNENRVSITPAGVKALEMAGHKVYIEYGAGDGCGFTDEEYLNAGASLTSADEVWSLANMVIKVKEPVSEEYKYFREDLILFTYLHLAADLSLTEAMLASGIMGIGYETVQTPAGALPLLTPMSEIAGRMAPQIGAQFLENHYGGAGILLGGVPGVKPAQVAIVGGGNVGTHAAQIALGMGARVTILDTNTDRLRFLDGVFRGQLETVYSSFDALSEATQQADVLIGAVLIPGARAPRIVTKEMVSQMKKGAVIVDVAIDQGGSVETINHITTHEDPVYERYGVVHYAVANIPGAVARTATFALTNVTLPYILKLANLGAKIALRQDPALLKGLNTAFGKITCSGVAESLGLDSADFSNLMVS